MLYRTGNLDLDQLRQKHVVIFGGGSVGSYCAHSLAHLVKKLTIIDPEILGEENIERHLAGYMYIGLAKVDAIAQIIADHYCLEPSVINPLRVSGFEALPALENADLAIEATNDPELRDQVNDWAQHFNVPLIYAGVYAGGSGWQTVILPQPRQVCYMCLELIRTIEPNRNPTQMGNYGEEVQPSEDGQLHGSPGLVSAVMALAATVAQQAIDVLLGNQSESTLYRTTYQPRDFMILNDEASIKIAGLSIELLQRLDLEPFELIENGKGFTLQQKTGSIAHIIRQAPGCPFHEAAPLEGAGG